MNKHYKALFEGLENELEVEKAKNADLRSEIEELKKKIILLNTQNNITANTTEQESPTDSLMQSKPKTVISADIECGAAVIGKTVINAAKYCNLLTTNDNKPYIKEMINLILGRCEVAKAEILKIVSDDLSVEEKKAAMDKEFKDADDYFQSIMAQKQ